MAEKLTPEQKQAVENRGGNLLVSAAAGSGKTKVLVERLMGYLTDPMHPANIDSFLIITYTKAAAAELRGKIAAKLSEKIAESPGNRHLQQQLQRLYLTTISTVHSFCADVLKQYAYMLDIPADFAIADELDIDDLKLQAMESVLGKAYETMSPDFAALITSQGLGRRDDALSDIVLKVHTKVMCRLEPEKWMDDFLVRLCVEESIDASETVWGKYLMEDLFEFLDLYESALAKLDKQIQDDPQYEGPHHNLCDTLTQIRGLRQCQTWDEIIRHKDFSYRSLVFGKNVKSSETADRIRTVRNRFKKQFEERIAVFSDSSGQLVGDLIRSAPAVRGLSSLLSDFQQEFSRLKKASRLLDFGDLEHKMLDLLYGRSRTGITSVAHEIGSRFLEIMVDEYQDSNEIQDSIFSALSQKRNNLFMVGDVKQSIYQFRLADPGIFLKKYHDYASPEIAQPGQGRKVLLSHNFRSSGAVLSGANFVFQNCMSESVGGLAYTESEALKEGIPHIPIQEPEIELYGVETKNESNRHEAEFVARRIRQLIDEKRLIRDGETLRPITPGDIVILLRSPGTSGQEYERVLNNAGFQVSTDRGLDLLATQEVQTLRSILSVISNPRQDIPLIATLSSPAFGFTAEELAQIRSENHRDSFYNALRQFHSEKTEHFFATLQKLRTQARVTNISGLMEAVFQETKLDLVYAAMKNGELENLQAFYQLAVQFDNSGKRDLENFLLHLDALKKRGLNLSRDEGQENAIRIFSIHKSKGLEFPVVFLCGLSKAFNRDDAKQKVILDDTLGIGISVADEKARVCYPNLAKLAILRKQRKDSLSEEMRILYVAMTRPKDRLIMTFTYSNREKALMELAYMRDCGDARLVTANASSARDWIVYSAMGRTEGGALIPGCQKPCGSVMDADPWLISSVQTQEQTPTEQPFADAEQEKSDLDLSGIQNAIRFCYPYATAVELPSKQTATQRKNRFKDQEAAESTDPPPRHEFLWRKPAFVQRASSAEDFGNAMHAAMQYLDFTKCVSREAVAGEIQSMVQRELISGQQAELIDAEMLYSFFQTDIGNMLIKGASHVREFKFSVLEDSREFKTRDYRDQILLQGVVDCALLEPDGITVVDFKTDHVTEDALPQKLLQYEPQVQTYASAMEKIYGAPIKGAYLYFFRLRRLLPIHM